MCFAKGKWDEKSLPELRSSEELSTDVEGRKGRKVLLSMGGLGEGFRMRLIGIL